MNNDEHRRLDRLMSGSPGPSVQEKEALLRTVLTGAGSQPGPAPNRAWVRWSLATAGAGLLLALLALIQFWPAPSETQGAFAARGGDAGGADFELACQPGNTPAGGTLECRSGGLLAFKLSAPAGTSYFSAAALGPDAKLRYYFPSRTAPSLPLGTDPLAGRGAVLGDDHPAGGYRVFGCFTAEPITPERLRAAIEEKLATGSDDMALIERAFEVIAP